MFTCSCIGFSLLCTDPPQLWRQGLPFVAVCRLLTAVAPSGCTGSRHASSVAVAFGLQSMQAAVLVAHRLRSCGTWAAGHAGFGASRLQCLWHTGSVAGARGPHCAQASVAAEAGSAVVASGL